MANPLTLIMPVIPGTSASTIVAALQANQANINAALTSIGTVHFARFLPGKRDPVGITDRAVIERELARAVAATEPP